MLHELSLATMKEVASGKVDAAVKHHLGIVAEDCYDRPGCKDVREVMILVRVTPVVDQDGLCESVSTEYVISSKVPKHVSAPVHCGLRKGGKMIFDDQEQQPLFKGAED